MGIGAGIFLVAVGAILTFAVDFTVSGLDIAVVGVILMVAGVAGIALELAVFAPRRRRVVAPPPPADRAYGDPGYSDPTYGEQQPPAARVRRETTTEYPSQRPMR